MRLSRMDIPRMRATAATYVGQLQAYRDRMKISLHFLMKQNKLDFVMKQNNLLAFCSKRA